MINRIRDIRKQKSMTLADVAERCEPKTTAQTIGRLETGMRNLSLAWMNRIASALEVDPEVLLKSEETEQPKVIARLEASGPEPIGSPRDAILPTALSSDGAMVVIEVDAPMGEYRQGDQIWLRQVSQSDHFRLINRDVLVPRPGGRFAFGRMIDRDDARIAVLPPGTGQRQIVIEHPAWVALAEMLVRSL